MVGQINRGQNNGIKYYYIYYMFMVYNIIMNTLLYKITYNFFYPLYVFKSWIKNPINILEIVCVIGSFLAVFLLSIKLYFIGWALNLWIDLFWIYWGLKKPAYGIVLLQIGFCILCINALMRI